MKVRVLARSDQGPATDARITHPVRGPSRAMARENMVCGVVVRFLDHSAARRDAPGERRGPGRERKTAPGFAAAIGTTRPRTCARRTALTRPT